MFPDRPEEIFRTGGITDPVCSASLSAWLTWAISFKFFKGAGSELDKRWFLDGLSGELPCLE